MQSLICGLFRDIINSWSAAGESLEDPLEDEQYTAKSECHWALIVSSGQRIADAAGDRRSTCATVIVYCRDSSAW